MSERINATGRRKKSIARIYLKEGKGHIIINNNKDLKTYFPTIYLQKKVCEPFDTTKTDRKKFDLKVRITGGGKSGQASAMSLALARALVSMNIENRPLLREHGLLTRDPRMVERKKYGRKKARKKFQFSKR